MNCDTLALATESVPCRAGEAADLLKLLEAPVDPDEDYEHHFMTVEVVDVDLDIVPDPSAIDPDTQVRVILCNDDERKAAWYHLPQSFLRDFGLIMAEAGKHEIRCGYVHTSDSPKLGDLGGGTFSITADGNLIEFTETDPRDLAQVARDLDSIQLLPHSSTAVTSVIAKLIASIKIKLQIHTP